MQEDVDIQITRCHGDHFMQLKQKLHDFGRPFLMLWLGTTISLAGTQLVGFALSVWVFQKTGSVLDFSGLIVASALPCLLILPFAGSFADRFDKRYVMIVSDSIAAIMSVILAYLIWHDMLQLWQMYFFNFVTAMAGSFQYPAYQAAVSTSISKDQMVRANGLMGASRSIISILTPMSAGILIEAIGLKGIVVFDLITFCIGTAFVIKSVSGLPSVKQVSDQTHIKRAISDFLSAMSFFKDQRLMLSMLAYEVFHCSLIVLVESLITPLVLSNHTTLELGYIMTWGAVGSLAGSGLLIINRSPKRLMTAFLSCNVILSLFIFIAGVGNSVILYSSCALLAMMFGSAGEGCSTALWMRKVPIDCQGRIFALIGTIMTISAPTVAVLGGWTADHIFEPALAPGGIWVDSIGAWLGIGKGRGLGLVFIVCGSLGMIVSLGALCKPKLRRVDELVPDGR